MDSAPLEGDAMKLVTILLVGILIIDVAAFSANVAPVFSQESKNGGQNYLQPTVIVVIGAAGTKEFGGQFAKSARLWEEACSKGDAKFAVLGLDKIEGSPALALPPPLLSQESTGVRANDRTTLQKILADEPKQTTVALWLVLIGHGTFDGRTAKFNLRGPDISADDLAEWLKPLLRPIAVINTASSSAPFLSKLSAQGRVVITATKSGYEQNYTRFGQYLAGAIAEPQADLDKDGQTSLLEAFLTASGRVDEFYSAAGRLVTEHALLDDNGDGLGTRADWFRGIRPVRKAENSASLDGYRAHQFHIVHSEAENKISPGLRAQRDRLELEVIKLRDAKEKFSEDEYFSKLEALLYDIAQIYEQTNEADNREQGRRFETLPRY
jgi:hypothetical protein